jgi:hypothetical protein
MTEMTALLIAFVAAVLILLYMVERTTRRLLMELRVANDTLEKCRKLLVHIAENMRRGPRVDLQRLFTFQDLKRALGLGADVAESASGAPEDAKPLEDDGV